MIAYRTVEARIGRIVGSTCAAPTRKRRLERDAHCAMRIPRQRTMVALTMRGTKSSDHAQAKLANASRFRGVTALSIGPPPLASETVAAPKVPWVGEGRIGAARRDPTAWIIRGQYRPRRELHMAEGAIEWLRAKKLVPAWHHTFGPGGIASLSGELCASIRVHRRRPAPWAF